jgi:hypothetical protein
MARAEILAEREGAVRPDEPAENGITKPPPRNSETCCDQTDSIIQRDIEIMSFRWRLASAE